jgi:hypothetical protein
MKQVKVKNKNLQSIFDCDLREEADEDEEDDE